MKLGLVAESQRPPDSPDTVLVVEPSIGSTTRTKGSLYLVVTGEGGGELRSATNMVAERVRHEYYYDESAGITVCLKKAIKAANRELRVTERLEARQGEAGPIGIALAVVRGNEVYVATVGPAEAYLVREARLLTLPEPDPGSGLPSEDGSDPEVWHGDLLAGDSLILISPNATRRIGLAPIQEAVIQLHPQVAIEQIHRQLTGGGLGVSGGDGMIALEADEVSVTQKTQPLKPVWPSDSLAGVPERSPIPLADSVIDGVSTVQHTAKQVQRTADGMLRHSLYGLFDRMPRRPVQRVRVTPFAVQRERQRRVASAVVGMLLVLAVVGASLWYLAGTRQPMNIDKQGAAQAAYLQVQSDLLAVFGQGRDLVVSDPQSARRYLEDAYKNLQLAKGYYPPEQLAALTTQVVGGLNRYYHVSVVTPQVVLSFGSDELTGIVLGPDGGAYVIDQTNSYVYRVDLVTRYKIAVAVPGEQPPGGGTVGTPRLLAVGGPDVLILDSANILWRWRPGAGAATGQGTLIKLNVEGSGTWGSGVRAIGTFLTDANLGQYTLYIVVPSAGQVLKYPASSDGSGYRAKDKSNYLLGENLSVSQVDDMYIDGSLYLLDNGTAKRYDSGQQVLKGWSADPPGDTVIRPSAPFYTKISADNAIADQGNLYAYDGGNRRIVSFTKNNGKYVQQFILPTTSPYLSALKGMFVRTGANSTNPVLYWIEGGNLLSAPLFTAAPASPSPSAKPKASPTKK
jgi:hypothetical protein